MELWFSGGCEGVPVGGGGGWERGASGDNRGCLEAEAGSLAVIPTTASSSSSS